MSRPIRLAGSNLGPRAHVCAFFDKPDQEYDVLLPFIKDGLDLGEKAVHTIDPRRCDHHVQRLKSAGIDVDTGRANGQLDLRDWSTTHLINGRFDAGNTLEIFDGVMQKARGVGFPLIRFITQMEWVLEAKMDVNDLLEYEARANGSWMRKDQPVHPVICTYDLGRFGGDVVVDVMRTHPLLIIGGILRENPFFVPPDQFLKELRERRSTPSRRVG